MKRSRPVFAAVAATFLLSCSSGGGDTPSTAAPTFSPDPTYAFGEPLAVTLRTATEGAAIHYTTDGNEPTSASSTYTEPIALTATTTIRAFASRSGATDSAVASVKYVRRPVDLVADGSAMGSDGINADSLMLNRYTPAPGAFPFMLRKISVYFASDPGAGVPIQLVVFTDDDGNLANGASLVLVHRTTVHSRYWSVFELPEPALLDGPGDVLVGVVVPSVTLLGVSDTNSDLGWVVVWPPMYHVPDPPLLEGSFLPISQGHSFAIFAWN